MISKATACLLIALTFISPCVCCCSVEAATNWVIGGIFQKTGIPQSGGCCHQAAHAIEHGGNTTVCEQRRHDDHERHCDGSEDDSHHCPCQEDGAPGTALPSTPELHASSGVNGLNSLLQLYVVPMLVVSSDVELSMSTEFFAPKGLCDTGQGILRAYGRLRI